MTKEVLIFLHMNDKSPGYIADFLAEKAVPYRVIRSYNNEPIPQLDDSIAGLVFMGGVMSANDDLPWLKEELRLIQQALAADVPILGHCLGGQLISKVLGQSISKNPVAEVGWHRCQTQNNAVAKEWLGDLDDFQMFHWHYETFAIPAQATHIFSSPNCTNQAYVVNDNVLAMQCHVEMTEPLVTHWVDSWPDHLVNSNNSEQNVAEIKAGLPAKVAELNRVAEQLYSRWIQSLKS
ncbi:type 1 glutamine amidotransferase [Dasania marina]|uniref:type 1 glutamine amidotransferase n=1 Tax=Dasania marina TaxID=471499 RepID=UPI0030D7E634